MKAELKSANGMTLTLDTEEEAWRKTVAVVIEAGNEAGDAYLTATFDAEQCRLFAGILLVAADAMERRAVNPRHP